MSYRNSRDQQTPAVSFLVKIFQANLIPIDIVHIDTLIWTKKLASTQFIRISLYAVELRFAVMEMIKVFKGGVQILFSI